MNPAIHAAIVAASQQEAIEEKVEIRLKIANALGPSTAIAFAPADESEQSCLKRLWPPAMSFGPMTANST
jgi:hypothetical protein